MGVSAAAWLRWCGPTTFRLTGRFASIGLCWVGETETVLTASTARSGEGKGDGHTDHS